MGKLFLKKLSGIISETRTIVLFFGIFVFSLPFWKRIELVTPYSFLDGKFIDYLTYSVFGFDIILTLIFVFWMVGVILKKEKMIFFDKKITLSFFLLILFSFLSLFFATYIPISLYYVFSLLVFFVLMLFVYNNIRTKRDLFLILNFFILSMFFQGVLAVIQFLKNESLGLLILGEQLVSPGLSGVAKTLINGSKHIRSYGTFSHPNILALFLLVALISTIYLFINYQERLYRAYLGWISLVLSVAIFFTFSRSIWLLTFLALIYFILRDMGFKNALVFLRKKKNICYSLFLICIILIILFYFSPSILWRIDPFLSSTWDSLRDRMVVFNKSWVLIKTHPWFGVGIGNFVIEIAYLLTGYPIWMAEPAHNTYIIILTEIGIFGLISFLFMLYCVYRKTRLVPISFRVIFATFILYMLFDHCFWDVRQVQYLFFIFIGLILVLADKKIA